LQGLFYAPPEVAWLPKLCQPAVLFVFLCGKLSLPCSELPCQGIEEQESLLLERYHQ
jgi:hypothetical protein